MIKPKKSLGQNFLIDNNILNKIVKFDEINNNNVVEIGPGTGNLTKKIIEQKPKNLILIEKDKTGFSRNDLEEHLLKNNIQTRRLFVGLHRQPVIKKYGIICTAIIMLHI